MTDDNKAAKELVETLRDGERGFSAAAEKLKGGDHASWADVLERLSKQRADFRHEIVALGDAYAEDVDKGGTIAAALHRGWMSLKDALAGDDPRRSPGGRCHWREPCSF